MAAVRRWM